MQNQERSEALLRSEEQLADASEQFASVQKSWDSLDADKMELELKGAEDRIKAKERILRSEGISLCVPTHAVAVALFLERAVA